MLSYVGVWVAYPSVIQATFTLYRIRGESVQWNKSEFRYTFHVMSINALCREGRGVDQVDQGQEAAIRQEWADTI